MAGPNAKKRSHQEFSVKNRLKAQRPLKKKKQKAYHSDSDEDENDNANFKPVNLLDSDDEEASHAAVARADASSDSNSDSDPGADSDGEASGRQKLKPKRQKPAAKAQPKAKAAKTLEKEEEEEGKQNSGEDEDDNEDEDEDEDDLDENDEFDISAGDDSDPEADEAGGKKAKSKRNDPSAFSNSLHKILSTKLATTRRADPLLSRSADAHKAAQAITDEQLESKAKRKLRQERLAALEKGRVRDVLVAPTNEQGQVEGESTPRSRSAHCAAALPPTPRGNGARLTTSDSEHRPDPGEGEAAPQSRAEGCHQTVQRRAGCPDQECRRREGDAPARLRGRQEPRGEGDGDEQEGLPGSDCQQRRRAQKGTGRGGVRRRRGGSGRRPPTCGSMEGPWCCGS